MKKNKFVLWISAIPMLVGFLLPTYARAAMSDSAVFNLVNAERVNAGLNPLTLNSKLNSSAQAKADDMATRNYFSHDTPEGKTPWTFFDNTGYKYSKAAENLAVTSDMDNAAEIVSRWMNSPGHRANILDPKLVETGIGIALGTYQGQQVVYIVQHFSVPLASPVEQVQPQIIQQVIPPVQPVQTVVTSSVVSAPVVEAVASVQTIPVAKPIAKPVAKVVVAKKVVTNSAISKPAEQVATGATLTSAPAQNNPVVLSAIVDQNAKIVRPSFLSRVRIFLSNVFSFARAEALTR
jgi:hypothetical protein